MKIKLLVCETYNALCTFETINLSYLVDGAKATFSKLVPCREIVRGESYGCHVKQRDVKVLVLTGFIFQLPVLDRSKWDTGVKRVEPLSVLKPPWIAQGKFSLFRTPGLARGFAETTAYISPDRNGRLGAHTSVSEKLVPDEESDEPEEDKDR